jgi:hypothetical protein
MEQPTVVTRDIVLGLPAGEAWELIGDAAGWADWMVDGADVTVVPGAEGTVREDDGERHVRIREVIDGERVSFEWWPTGSEDGTSVVELAVIPTPVGEGLRIVETFPAPRRLTATASMAWEVRATCAWMRCHTFAAA